VQRVSAAGVVAPSTQVLRDQSFLCRPVDFGWRIEWARGSAAAKHSSVKEIEFWVGCQNTLGAIGEDVDSKSRQQILEKFQLTFNSLAADLTVTGSR